MWGAGIGDPPGQRFDHDLVKPVARRLSVRKIPGAQNDGLHVRTAIGGFQIDADTIGGAIGFFAGSVIDS